MRLKEVVPASCAFCGKTFYLYRKPPEQTDLCPACDRVLNKIIESKKFLSDVIENYNQNLKG